MLIEGFVPYRKEDAEKYEKYRYWAGLTLGDMLDKAADIYPNKEALIDAQGRLTYCQVREKANRLAIALMDLGINSMDRVVIQLPNWNEFIYSYFAVQKIGAIPLLLIDRYRQYEISQLNRMAGATAWIVPEKYRKTDYLPIIPNVLKENPQTRHVILARGEKHEKYSSLEKLIEDAELTDENLTRLADRRPDPMQVAHMGPTGGTTGLPKIVPHIHNASLCNAEYAARAWDMTSDDICLAAGPVGHDLTFTKGVLGVLFTYGTLVLLDSKDMGEVCSTIEKEKITSIVWVPALASRLVNYDGLDNYDLSSLKKMHCGGGPSPPELIRSVTNNLNVKYFYGYGGTEGMSTLTRSDYDLEKVCCTVGSPTCPYDIYKVTDPGGNELPPNTQGELLVKGPGVLTGYYKAPEENEKVFDKEGFFKTGDLATIDESGAVMITGRIKEMINRGGESISTTGIENLIIEHPDILSVAVIGMPDPDLGERACAYIQTRADITLSFEDVTTFLKSKKASVLQLPERIEFIDSLPMTKAEKVDKRALLEDIKGKLGVK